MMPDLYLMNKVVILKKIQVAMKTFVPPFFDHFSLSLSRKKRVVMMRAMRKKLNIAIYASATDLLHIRIGNLNWYKCGHCKNEARETDCICCREIAVDVMLINLAKSPQREGSISPSSFYGQLPD